MRFFTVRVLFCLVGLHDFVLVAVGECFDRCEAELLDGESRHGLEAREYGVCLSGDFDDYALGGLSWSGGYGRHGCFVDVDGLGRWGCFGCMTA